MWARPRVACAGGGLESPTGAGAAVPPSAPAARPWQTCTACGRGRGRASQKAPLASMLSCTSACCSAASRKRGWGKRGWGQQQQPVSAGETSRMKGGYARADRLHVPRLAGQMGCADKLCEDALCREVRDAAGNIVCARCEAREDEAASDRKNQSDRQCLDKSTCLTSTQEAPLASDRCPNTYHLIDVSERPSRSDRWAFGYINQSQVLLRGRGKAWKIKKG